MSSSRRTGGGEEETGQDLIDMMGKSPSYRTKGNRGDEGAEDAETKIGTRFSRGKKGRKGGRSSLSTTAHEVIDMCKALYENFRRRSDSSQGLVPRQELRRRA